MLWLWLNERGCHVRITAAGIPVENGCKAIKDKYEKLLAVAWLLSNAVHDLPEERPEKFLWNVKDTGSNPVNSGCWFDQAIQVKFKSQQIVQDATAMNDQAWIPCENQHRRNHHLWMNPKLLRVNNVPKMRYSYWNVHLGEWVGELQSSEVLLADKVGSDKIDGSIPIFGQRLRGAISLSTTYAAC